MHEQCREAAVSYRAIEAEGGVILRLTTNPGARRASLGFTLLEIMAVLGIIALTYGMGMHYFKKPEKTGTAGVAERYLGGLEHARRKAVENNRVTVFTVAPDGSWTARWRDTGQPFDSNPGAGRGFSIETYPIREIAFNGIGMASTGESLNNFMQRIDFRQEGSKTFHRIHILLGGAMKIVLVDPEAPAPQAAASVISPVTASQ